jgi:hypothetical protein
MTSTNQIAGPTRTTVRIPTESGDDNVRRVEVEFLRRHA